MDVPCTLQCGKYINSHFKILGAEGTSSRPTIQLEQNVTKQLAVLHTAHVSFS